MFLRKQQLARESATSSEDPESGTRELANTKEKFVVCEGCGILVEAKIKEKPGNFALLMALILCVFACWPLSLIPLLARECKDEIYYCPHCENIVKTNYFCN